MFTPRSYAVHAPALSLPEAAMLPALAKEREPVIPRSLVLPDRRTYYPMPAPGTGQTAGRVRRGSMAGRAVLTYIQNAPPKRTGR